MSACSHGMFCPVHVAIHVTQGASEAVMLPPPSHTIHAAGVTFPLTAVSPSSSSSPHEARHLQREVGGLRRAAVADARPGLA